MNRLDAEKILQINTSGLTSYSREDLRRIYRRLAKQYHPDFHAKNVDTHTTAQQMARINEAYDYLNSCFDQLNKADARLELSGEHTWVKDASGWAHSTADNSAHTSQVHRSNDATNGWRSTDFSEKSSPATAPAHPSAPSRSSAASRSSSAPTEGAATSASVEANVADAWRDLDERHNRSHQTFGDSYQASKTSNDTTSRSTGSWPKTSRTSKASRYTHYTDAYTRTPQKAAEFAREILSEKHQESRRVIAEAARTPQPKGAHPLRRFATKGVAKAFWSMTPLRLKVYLTCALCALLVFITALIAYLMHDLPSAFGALVALLLLLALYCFTPQPSAFITQMILASDARLHKGRRSNTSEESENVIEGKARRSF